MVYIFRKTSKIEPLGLTYAAFCPTGYKPVSLVGPDNTAASHTPYLGMMCIFSPALHGCVCDHSLDEICCLPTQGII